MKFIADTHAFLWFISDSPQLSKQAKSVFESSDNERLLSLASIWEMAIKESLGKLSFSHPIEQFLPEQIKLNYFQVFDISMEHALRIARLPLYHRDPFDRMIVAQALAAELPIVSSDKALDAYGVRRLW